MSTWAYTRTGIPIVATAKMLPTGVTFDDDFFCPSCHCGMYYKSASSNGRSAHFAGKHESWCDIGYTSDNDGTIRDYVFTDETLPDFLNKLISDGVKEPSAEEYKQSTKSSASKTTITPISSYETPQNIKTVRQLFNVLSSSLPDDELYSGVKVKDVYCGVNTQFLYTKYVNGLHLVYAEYKGYSSKAPILFCSYPSREEEQIKIYVHFNDDQLFTAAKMQLKGHYGKHILIFASFINNNCNVASLTQIVPLRK